jgi:hypothetical protein
MKLTRERKILFGVLAAGGVALLCDRLSGGGGAAPAAAEAVEMPAKPATAHASVASGGAASAKVKLSARIARLDQTDAAGSRTMAAYRDPFHVSSEWCASAMETRTDASAKHEPPPPGFDQVHHLTAVIVSGRHSSAVVDGSLLEVGQTVAGHTLIAVTQDMAVFDHEGSRVLLRLEAGKKSN